MNNLHTIFGDVFRPITDATWAAALKQARDEGNAMVEEIRRRVRAEEQLRSRKSSPTASAGHLSITEPVRGADSDNFSTPQSHV